MPVITIRYEGYENGSEWHWRVTRQEVYAEGSCNTLGAAYRTARRALKRPDTAAWYPRKTR